MNRVKTCDEKGVTVISDYEQLKEWLNNEE